MRTIMAAVAAGLLLAAPAAGQTSQTGSGAEAVRALRGAEAELRDTITRIDEGTLPASMARSRLRQALSDVERAMLGLPSGARQGANWQTAVREVSAALSTVREEGADLPAARAKAGEALGTLPALRGEETGSEGG